MNKRMGILFIWTPCIGLYKAELDIGWLQVPGGVALCPLVDGLVRAELDTGWGAGSRGCRFVPFG